MSAQGSKILNTTLVTIAEPVIMNRSSDDCPHTHHANIIKYYSRKPYKVYEQKIKTVANTFLVDLLVPTKSKIDKKNFSII